MSRAKINAFVDVIIDAEEPLALSAASIQGRPDPLRFTRVGPQQYLSPQDRWCIKRLSKSTTLSRAPNSWLIHDQLSGGYCYAAGFREARHKVENFMWCPPDDPTPLRVISCAKTDVTGARCLGAVILDASKRAAWWHFWGGLKKGMADALEHIESNGGMPLPPNVSCECHVCDVMGNAMMERLEQAMPPERRKKLHRAAVAAKTAGGPRWSK